MKHTIVWTDDWHLSWFTNVVVKMLLKYWNIIVVLSHHKASTFEKKAQWCACVYRCERINNLTIIMIWLIHYVKVLCHVCRKGTQERVCFHFIYFLCVHRDMCCWMSPPYHSMWCVVLRCVIHCHAPQDSYMRGWGGELGVDWGGRDEKSTVIRNMMKY